MKSKLKIYWKSLRAFTLFWILANTIFAVGVARYLTGKFELMATVFAFLCVNLVLFFAHELNNVFDYLLKVDKVEKGSTAKTYTLASQLIPQGLLSVKEAIFLGLICLSLGVVCLFFVLNLWTLIFFIIGVSLSISYTIFFKRYGLQEIALAGGHGIASTCFVYSAITCSFEVYMLLASLIPAIFASGMITLDAWKDIETDFSAKVKTCAQYLFSLDVSPGTYMSWIFSLVIISHISLIFLRILPETTLAALFIIPGFHLASALIEKRFEKGMILFLVCMFAYPLVIGSCLFIDYLL